MMDSVDAGPVGYVLAGHVTMRGRRADHGGGCELGAGRVQSLGSGPVRPLGLRPGEENKAHVGTRRIRQLRQDY